MNANIIRAGIFFTAGIVSILFRKKLDKLKNYILKKLNLERRIKDETKIYLYNGIIFIIIGIILLLFSDI